MTLDLLQELVQAGQLQKAELLLRGAEDPTPRSAQAKHNLAVLIGAQGRWTESIRLLRQARRQTPNDDSILSDLGKALLEARRPHQARKVLLEAKSRAASPEILVRLAKVLIMLGEKPAALAECEAAGSFLPALRLRAKLLSVAGRHHEALALFQPAIDSLNPAARRPDDLAIYATLHWHCGNTEESLALASLLIANRPVTPNFHSMYISARLHSPTETVEAAGQAARAWGSLYAQIDHQPVRRPLPRRPLRIGYVTQEFQRGPAIHFILPLLEARNRQHFHITGFHCGPQRDPWTRRAARQCDQWRTPATAAELEAAVRHENLDLLVDLSGHYGTYLTLFEKRHAPVQLSFPNYPGSTGAEHMDYILTDRWVCPPGTETQYSEQPLWLNSGYLPYRPPLRPRLSPPPSLATGVITFCLLQRPSKLNDAVWDAVARILDAVPASRLLLHYSAAELDHPDSLACLHFRAALSVRGVSPARLLFRGSLPLKDHWALLAQVDIGLDTFPYNGQTTTCECLWMGVPVVTLRGSLHVARVGWQILDRIGSPELVADTADQYVAQAVTLAHDRSRLLRYRRGLRRAFLASPLMNGSVVKDIETAFKKVTKQ